MDANTGDELPGKEFVNQELRLPSPLPVRIIIGIVPISRLHNLPIYFVEILEIIIELGQWRHFRMSVSKDPTQITIPVYGFH